jgi:hypothetical protein
MHPDFPVVSGSYQMTKDWTIVLPGQFNRRFEEGSMVLWRPGLTIWVNVWNNDHNQTRADRLARIKSKHAPEATDLEEAEEEGLTRFCYRLKEESEDDRVAAFYGFAFGENGEVLISVYFDDESDIAVARSVWLSLRETTGD